MMGKYTKDDYVQYALGELEKLFDNEDGENVDMSELTDEALRNISKKYNIDALSDENILDDIRTEVEAVVDHAEETCSDLSEFNVGQSGVCAKCTRIILSGQEGISLTEIKAISKEGRVCTYCEAEYLRASDIEEDKKRLESLTNGLTDYGKMLIDQDAEGIVVC